MAHDTRDVIVFGKGGQWLAKNEAAIKSHFNHTQIVGVADDWSSLAVTTTAQAAVIMTPPDTHKDICLSLLKNPNIKKIYCEKPFPDIADEDFPPDFKDKIRVIDHYLLKSTPANHIDLDIYLDRYKAWQFLEKKIGMLSSRFGLGNSKVWRLSQRYLGRWYFNPGAYTPITSNSFATGLFQHIWHSLIYLFIFLFRLFTLFTGWVPVKYIEIDIKETDEEKRPWMNKGDKYGGVVTDLSHHALAILLRMFGEKALKRVVSNDITIRKVRYFDPESKDAISELNFLILIGRCTVRINVAKGAVNTTKKISLFKKFMAHAKPNQTYSLTEAVRSKEKRGYDYAENFTSEASCLTYSETTTLNKICHRVVNLAHHVKNKETTRTADKMALITTLTDQFKHRHSFYWQSYYKLVIYQVIILLAPYAFAINLTKGTKGIALTIFALTTIISLWVYFWGVQKVTAVLSEEHIRMKVVHDRLKELLNTTKIDLSVISINESSISDVMQIQYRFLVRGFCVLNPIVIYFMYHDEISKKLDAALLFLKSCF